MGKKHGCRGLAGAETQTTLVRLDESVAGFNGVRETCVGLCRLSKRVLSRPGTRASIPM